ncbi:MAG: 3,4-dihydroxy-2-butanone-4-phosphate synthase, partial [Acidiphilium sp. 21-68-69]
MDHLKSASLQEYLASAEEIIEEARAGRMFILVDDEDRENEGDLVIPAQFATPDAVNFMARHARGLICLALTRARCETLGLKLMAQSNGSRHETAFTVSIEAREGVTTGISAADRARTVAVAINPECGAADIVTPGHIFPLMARDGGTLVRTGHTEAAVDIARLAGLTPAGVICEIMNDDGTMARLPDLVSFAQYHNLKLGTIADLIAYRRRMEKLVRRAGDGLITDGAGQQWRSVVYENTIDRVE